MNIVRVATGWPRRRAVDSRRWLVILGAIFTVAVLLAGCTSSPDQSAARAPWSLDTPDPPPVPDSQPETVGVDGATVTLDGVEVLVPRGAVAPGSAIEVRSAQAGGELAGQVFGKPAIVDHAEPLLTPLTLRWILPSLSEQQRATITIVRWDPAAEAWAYTAQPFSIEGDTLVAQVSEFSAVSWTAIAQQKALELADKRREAPVCSGALHPWVRGIVDPDEDEPRAAIRVCFAPDRDEIITARVVNNRPFTQRLQMTGGDQQWAWTWPGQADTSIAGIIYGTARSVFDSGTSYLLPPVSEVAVGIGRPDSPGEVVIAATAKVDPTTVLADVVRYTFEGLPIGGFNNPLANVFVQVLFECGGKQLLGVNDPGIDVVVRRVVEVVGGCAQEITRPDSEFGAVFEARLQEMTRGRTPADAAGLVKANRIIHQVVRAFAVVRFVDYQFYMTDQFANAAVGPLTLSVRGSGRAQNLGVWTPTCNNVKTDSNLLYRNLALQDIFSDKSKELWQFASWRSSARQAVQPLARCSSTYLKELAAQLPTSWGDPRAAQVVVEELSAVRGANPTTSRLDGLALTARSIGPVEFGEQQDVAIAALQSSLGEPTVVRGACFLTPEDITVTWGPLAAIFSASDGLYAWGLTSGRTRVPLTLPYNINIGDPIEVASRGIPGADASSENPFDAFIVTDGEMFWWDNFGDGSETVDYIATPGTTCE